MFAPIVRLDQGMTQPMQATASSNGVIPQQATSVAETQNATAQGSLPMGQSQPFNFGVAQFDRLGGMTGEGGVGQDINGKSLGEVARELKQTNTVNARTFTNNDINNLNQSGGISGTATAATGKQDNWSPDNGVINPNGMPAEPNAVGAPQQDQQQPTGVRSPFAPRSQSYNPAPSNEPGPQAYEKPSAQLPVEMAQNNEGPLSQDQNTNQASNSQAQPSNDKAKGSQLPGTASKLPLIGVLGLFTVCAGIFVRYQRARAR
jgi:hypothetical protein